MTSREFKYLQKKNVRRKLRRLFYVTLDIKNQYKNANPEIMERYANTVINPSYYGFIDLRQLATNDK